MESTLTTALPQLGTAGAAIFVMWLMYKDASAKMSAKDKTLVEQVEKHEHTLKAHQEYMREIHSSTIMQLNHASKVIEDNIKSHERVITMLDKKTDL